MTAHRADWLQAVEWATQIAARTGRRMRVRSISRRVWAIEPT